MDEYRHVLAALLAEAGVTRAPAAVLGSVVPDATAVLVPTLDSLVDGVVRVVGPQSRLSIELDVEEPHTVGADRIVNTLAARELYGRDTVAVDLGTATTFDLITADGVFMGGVIAPGLAAGLEWLGRRAAKLPRVELVPPPATGSSEEASIAYAIEVLHVPAIIVCGHTHCGAIAALSQDASGFDPALAAWLKNADVSRAKEDSMLARVHANVIAQTERLRRLPAVARAVADARLKVHGWCYDIETGRISVLDPQSGEFLPLVMPASQPADAARRASGASPE